MDRFLPGARGVHPQSVRLLSESVRVDSDAWGHIDGPSAVIGHRQRKRGIGKEAYIGVSTQVGPQLGGDSVRFLIREEVSCTHSSPAPRLRHFLLHQVQEQMVCPYSGCSTYSDACVPTHQWVGCKPNYSDHAFASQQPVFIGSSKKRLKTARKSTGLTAFRAFLSIEAPHQCHSRTTTTTIEAPPTIPPTIAPIGIWFAGAVEDPGSRRKTVDVAVAAVSAARTG